MRPWRLPNALSVALRPLFSFSADPICLSFSAGACAILQALCWYQQHQQVCHFSSFLLLSDSRSVLTTLSSPPSFLLPQSLWQELSSLSSCPIRLQWVPGHSYLPGNNAADKLARWGTLLTPSAIPCSLSPLISRIHSCLFSDWRRTVSSKIFEIQVPAIFTEELVFHRHARCVLSPLRCNGHSLLLSSYLSRIGRIESYSCSACGHLSSHSALSRYGLFAPLALWRLSVSLQSLVQARRNCPVTGAPWYFCRAPIPQKGSGNNNSQS